MSKRLTREEFVTHGMTTHEHGEPVTLLIEGASGDTYYVGDLEAGKALVARDRYVFEGPRPLGYYGVDLCDTENPDDVAEWGRGATPEEAWRYALGAAMGPIDADYDEAALRRALKDIVPGATL
jgi:hypothetical protein